MSKPKKTNIAWTDYTVNFWWGCHKIVEACRNCYMFRDSPRFGRDPNEVTRIKSKVKPKKGLQFDFEALSADGLNEVATNMKNLSKKL